MQKTNTALLVVVLALVLGLWFRPQPDRYRNLVGEDYYLLDTATGTVVLPKVSEGVEDHIRKKEEKRKAEADAAPERRARLTESLNLTGTPKRPYPNILPSQLGQVEECTKRAKVEKEERSPKKVISATLIKKRLAEVWISLDKPLPICYKGVVMQTYSTREVAIKLGIHRITLQRYISRKLVPVPPLKSIGGGKFREWNKTNVERVRKQLLKIRKDRNKKRATA